MNERADQEANRARESQDTGLQPADVTCIQFQLGTQTGTIREYPRRMLRSQARRTHEICLLSSSHGRALPEDPALRRITVAALKSCAASEPALLTSQGNSTFRAFRHKFLAGLLPLGCRSRLWGV
jgi:hypothetical protein